MPRESAAGTAAGAGHGPGAPGPASGVPGLDELLEGLRVGDNVVWEAPRSSWAGLATAFRSANPSGFCHVCVDLSPSEVLARRPPAPGERLVLVDCHGSSGELPRIPGARIVTVGDHSDVEAMQAVMRGLEYELGEGAGYAFESLTGMQRLWGPEAAVNFFLRHCPRLYRLGTVAYWFLEAGSHDPGFLQGLARLTQVVLAVEEDGADLRVRVVKADARTPEVAGRTALLRGVGGGLEVVSEPAPDRARAGELLRRARLGMGMSQAELARRIGVSSSALSQAERGRRGLSPATLLAAWRELGVDPAGGEGPAPAPSYTVARRGERKSASPAPGVTAEKVMQNPQGFELHLMTFAPGALGRRALFATKRPEVVLVTEGVLQLRIGDTSEVLHAGDAILISGQPLAGWRNPGPVPARATWAVLP